MIRGYQTQRGDAMAIVVVILAVALVATLGFIAWQNFFQKEPAAPEEASKSEQVSQEEDPVLALTSWGVEVPLGEETTQYQASYEAFDGGDVRGVYYITTMIDECEASVGAVSRIGRVDEEVTGEQYLASDNVTAGQTWGELAREPGTFGAMPVANGYVYTYTSPQALSCSAETGERETQAMRTFSSDLFPGLRASS